jgi:hypothetical protein
MGGVSIEKGHRMKNPGGSQTEDEPLLKVGTKTMIRKGEQPTAWTRTEHLVRKVGILLVLAAGIAYSTSTGYLIAENSGDTADIRVRSAIPVTGYIYANSIANENLQLIEYINTDCKKIEAEVKFTKSIKQEGKKGGSGEMDAALANGLTPSGRWYQGGIVNDVDEGLMMNYTIFNNKGLGTTTGNVHFNKDVDISHEFRFGISIDDSGMINVYVKDLNNGAEATAHFQGVAGEYFVASSGSNEHGYFTGLMRERWNKKGSDISSIPSETITLVSPEIGNANFSMLKTNYRPFSHTELRGQERVLIADSRATPAGHSSISLKLNNSPETYFMPSAQESRTFGSFGKVEFTVSRTEFRTRGSLAHE